MNERLYMFEEFLEETEYVDYANDDIKKLAFKLSSAGEIDYKDNHSYPDEKLMIVLKKSTDAIDMILHHLPDTLGYDAFA